MQRDEERERWQHAAIIQALLDQALARNFDKMKVEKEGDLFPRPYRDNTVGIRIEVRKARGVGPFARYFSVTVGPERDQIVATLATWGYGRANYATQEVARYPCTLDSVPNILNAVSMVIAARI